MIPRAHVTAWRSRAPWALDEQVEQDLVLSRAIVEIANDPLLSTEFAFRGGTTLHKLHLHPPARYSEDIDLVQVEGGPIGPAINAIRARLDPWLGKPKWKLGQSRVTLRYRFESEIPPVTSLRLKVEINTREHFTVLGLRRLPFAVDNPWFAGETGVATYEPEEILGTKLRALYQRKKGRDLFDLDVALERLPELDPGKIIECFERYLAQEGSRVTRAELEANLARKLEDAAFLADTEPLLAIGQRFDAIRAGARIGRVLVTRLPGDPWKGSES